ncbi:hypothetical protein KDA_24690 [Dictyobacter alpinus]|uniref:Uncharacterized protein n=1 Tax=Dictyobacter alpinus TaxID=2014873 RepID=A0A402B6L0_9CHLR|nr:hypothetical protein [Dictyobacter alpinus]GCE26985.1 hypothetical protein KDA_24690 [Dictyobacter alpinus]
MYCTIDWLASLTPEMTMVPADTVFLHNQQQRSLTAIYPHIPGLLFSSPDTLVDLAIRVLSLSADQETVAQHTQSSPEINAVEADVSTLDTDFALFLDA